MKHFILVLFVFVGSVSFAQTSGAKGEIKSAPSLPGTLGFVVTGTAAQAMYDQLSCPATAEPYFLPAGMVDVKVGKGLSCRHIKEQNEYWCEMSVTPSGILIM